MIRECDAEYMRKFEELFKKADDPSGTQVDAKDEQRMTAGTNDLYEQPADRSPTAWGEPVADPVQYSDGVVDEAKADRGQLLDRAFAQKPAAERVDQQLVGQLFVHGVHGDYEAHSPLLQPKTRSKLSHVRQPTLRERLRELMK